MRINPPVKALTPATMSVVPRVNSLIGMPNPIAAMPTAASTIPNKDKITDMVTFRPDPPSSTMGMMLWLLKNFDPVPLQPQ
jgi:hypothetical protein